MTYSHDGKSRAGSGGVVSLEKAREIARQRDRFAEEVERLRRENRQLSEARREAEHEARALREELEAREDRREEFAEPTGSDEKTAAEQRVDRLESRIEGLTGDLERVRRKSEGVETAARREERVRLLAGLAAVLESIEQGLSMASTDSEREGLEAIYSQIVDYLRREGAELVGEVGGRMDPRRHEAVDVVEAPDRASSEIVEVVRHGIALEDGRIALPARVRVST